MPFNYLPWFSGNVATKEDRMEIHEGSIFTLNDCLVLSLFLFEKYVDWSFTFMLDINGTFTFYLFKHLAISLL